jgi:hypothetical protein
MDPARQRTRRGDAADPLFTRVAACFVMMKWPAALTTVVQSYLMDRRAGSLVVYNRTTRRVRLVDMRPEIMIPETEPETETSVVMMPVLTDSESPVSVCCRPDFHLDFSGGWMACVTSRSGARLSTWEPGQSTWTGHDLALPAPYDPVRHPCIIVGGNDHFTVVRYEGGEEEDQFRQVDRVTGAVKPILMPETGVTTTHFDPIRSLVVVAVARWLDMDDDGGPEPLENYQSVLHFYSLTTSTWQTGGLPVGKPGTACLRWIFPLSWSMCPPGHPDLLCLAFDDTGDPESTFVYSPSTHQIYGFPQFNEVFRPGPFGGAGIRPQLLGDRYVRLGLEPCAGSTDVERLARSAVECMDTCHIQWNPTIHDEVYRVVPSSVPLWRKCCSLKHNEVLGFE